MFILFSTLTSDLTALNFCSKFESAVFENVYAIITVDTSDIEFWSSFDAFYTPWNKLENLQLPTGPKAVSLLPNAFWAKRPAIRPLMLQYAIKQKIWLREIFSLPKAPNKFFVRKTKPIPNGKYTSRLGFEATFRSQPKLRHIFGAIWPYWDSFFRRKVAGFPMKGVELSKT